MSLSILHGALIYAQAVLAISFCLACVRIQRGPRAQDRVLGLDTLYVNGMLILLVSGMKDGSVFFFEAAMIIGVLGFVATVSLAKFLTRGELIE